MKIRITREHVVDFLKKLDATYKPSEEKPLVKVAEAALFLPALGLFYLWEYFNKFNIRYFLYFDLKDALEVLYSSLMPIIFIGAVFSFMLGMLVPEILKRIKDNGDQAIDSGDGEEISRRVSALSNFSAIVITVAILTGFYVLMQLYHFEITAKIVLLIVAAVAAYLHLKGYRNLGFIVVVVLFITYAAVRARTDAEQTKKEKPSYNVFLKNHSDVPILSEGIKSRYLIYKTSNYYFIKDINQKMIFIYSISNNETASFKSED